MGRVIVAFERQTDCERLREILESTGEFSCLVCRSGAQVKRAVHKLHAQVVICGFKLPDESCEAIYGDLPEQCVMLMMAAQGQLELCGEPGIFKLPTPIHRSELLTSVRLLAQFAAALHSRVPERTQEEQALVKRAKEMLMEHSGMSEDQAHRFLQKQSMDNGVRLVDTARRMLKER